MKENLNEIRLSKHLALPSKAALSHSSELDGVRLSPHFKLSEFLNGCHLLLEPARVVAGPLIINSGFRNPEVNQRVGVSVLPSTFSARLPISGRKTLRSFGRSLNS